jgi:hypothetical protein
MKERISQVFNGVKTHSQKGYTYIVRDIRRRPLFNFFLALIILFFVFVWRASRASGRNLVLIGGFHSRDYSTYFWQYWVVL